MIVHFLAAVGVLTIASALGLATWRVIVPRIPCSCEGGFSPCERCLDRGRRA